MMKKLQMKTGIKILALAILLIAVNAVKAQEQEIVQSIGLRLGGNGISYKYVEDQYKGFETILAFREHGVQFTGLVEFYKPIKTDRISNLFFFWGVGGHAGYKGIETSYCQCDSSGSYISSDIRHNPVLGFDGIFGGEYQFYSIPLAVSLDYKPYIEFFGKDIFRLDLWDFGLTLRYTF